MITSKGILEQTGISRATLNNYIKLGILPRPIVSSPKSDEEGAKQIGFFPAEALQWIREVKAMKRQGKTMTAIASQFQDKEWVRKLTAATAVIGSTAPRPDKKQTANSCRRRSGQAALQVTIENISSPAYLVNNNLEIEWINEQAEESIFHQNISSLFDIEERNIFKLLLAPALCSVTANWKEMIDLHCTLLQRNLNQDSLADICEQIGTDHAELLHNAYRQRQPPAPDNFYRIPFSLVGAATSRREHFSVHCETYREGMFIVFIPAAQKSSSLFEVLAQREKIISELLDNRMVSMVSMCALVASIQDSERLCSKLLPTQYFQLINDLWRTVAPVFEKYFGTYGRNGGNEMVYYFTRKHDDQYLMDSINCAMELRALTAEFSDFWNSKHGINHRLHLNIGIHEGQEFFGTIHSGANVEFTALGDSVKVARKLSEFATNGEIWATKALISRIPTDDRNSLTFGVYRNQEKGKVLQRDSFSLAGDLLAADAPTGIRLESITNVAITEITERRSKQ